MVVSVLVTSYGVPFLNRVILSLVSKQARESKREREENTHPHTKILMAPAMLKRVYVRDRSVL